MSFLPSDPLNCEIIAHSLGLQRQIPVITHPDGLVVGAQQAMPKSEHRNLFSPENPLPWVPDRVGTGFSRENNGVLVVGSSYNGFIEGYSQRSMKLDDYLAIRDLIREGNEGPAHSKVAEACAKFVSEFEGQVMQPDRATYYGPILKSLLGDAGIPASSVCLTDLCKASFVQMGKVNGNGTRLDVGHDGIVQKNWKLWTQFLTCKAAEHDAPLACQWIWKRMQQCRHIVALGTIAEYGVRWLNRQPSGRGTAGESISTNPLSRMPGGNTATLIQPGSCHAGSTPRTGGFSTTGGLVRNGSCCRFIIQPPGHRMPIRATLAQHRSSAKWFKAAKEREHFREKDSPGNQLPQSCKESGAVCHRHRSVKSVSESDELLSPSTAHTDLLNGAGRRKQHRQVQTRRQRTCLDARDKTINLPKGGLGILPGGPCKIVVRSCEERACLTKHRDQILIFRAHKWLAINPLNESDHRWRPLRDSRIAKRRGEAACRVVWGREGNPPG